MAYLRNTDFDDDDTRLRSNADDLYLRRSTRAHDSYSPTLTVTLPRENEFFDSKYSTGNHDHRVSELERELRRSQELEETHNKTVKQLRQVLEATEREASELTKSRSKAQMTISELQSHNRQLQDRMLELENRLRRQLDEKDESSHNVLHWQRNYDQLRHAVCKWIFPDGHEGKSHEAILRKLEDTSDDRTKFELHSLKLEDELSKFKDESKLAKESLKRALDDLDRIKKHAVHADMMKEEKEMAVRKQKQLEDELKKFEERLVRTHQRFEESQAELRDCKSKLMDVDTLTRRQNLAVQANALELKSFKETLATLLSDVYPTVQPTEESLKDKIRQLALNKHEVDNASKHLESKLQELSKQLEEQAHLHKIAVQRARKSEEEVDRLKQHLRSLEGELTATDILKNGLKADKHKYVEFCQQLAHIMKLDTIANELGMELNGDSLLTRAEQLANLEQDSLSKRRVMSSALERQLHDAKKQLESKDMHLDSMRKKLAHVETEASHRAEKDWHDLMEKNKRLKIHSEKLEKQLHDAKTALHETSQHGETADSLKRTCEFQRRSILDLEKQIVELEQIRSKQAKKIQQLKADHSDAEHHGTRAAESNAQALLDETHKLKQQLSAIIQREKQLLDLRQVIARMLGLDAQTLAVPDYEIIRRLEALVESQNEFTLASRNQGIDHQHLNTIRRNHSAHLVKSSSFGDGLKSGRRHVDAHRKN